ncbi:Opacity protein-like surface antigen [Vibrio chagasii]|nr:Opacity protein-like surface antigen [Vibrio chagasii]
MKKVLLAVVCGGLFSTQALAADVDYFVGGGLGGQFADAKMFEGYDPIKEPRFEDDFDSLDKTSGAMNFHVRGGAIIDNTHRFTFTINHAGDDKLSNYSEDGYSETLELKQLEFLVSYDYMYGLTNDVSVFGGVSLGSVKNQYTWTDSDTEGTSKDKIKSTDLAAGLQVGAQYKINDNWSTDLTYRHMFSSMDEKLDHGEGYYEKYEVNGHGSLTLSVDYRF